MEPRYFNLGYFKPWQRNVAIMLIFVAIGFTSWIAAASITVDREQSIAKSKWSPPIPQTYCVPASAVPGTGLVKSALTIPNSDGSVATLVRWTGWLRPAVDGAHTFHVADARVRVTLQQQPVVDSKQATSSPINLVATNFYSIIIEAPDGDVPALEWTAPSGTKQAVPVANLYAPVATLDTKPAQSQKTQTQESQNNVLI